MNRRIGLSFLPVLCLLTAPLSAQSVSGKSLADYMGPRPRFESLTAYQPSANAGAVGLGQTAAMPVRQALAIADFGEFRPISLVGFPEAPKYAAVPEPPVEPQADEPSCTARPFAAKVTCTTKPLAAAPTCQAQPLAAAPTCGVKAAAPRCGTVAVSRANNCQPLGGLFSGLLRGGCGCSHAVAAKATCATAAPTCAVKAPTCAAAPTCAVKAPTCAAAPTCTAKPPVCGNAP